MRLSYSLHDIRNPWTGNTNFINGFYNEPNDSEDYRYLDARLVKYDVVVVGHHSLGLKD